MLIMHRIQRIFVHRHCFSVPAPILMISQKTFMQAQQPSSSWCGDESPASHMSGQELERLFVDGRVQNLLTSLTGRDLAKINRYRRTTSNERIHHALMTDAMLKEYLGRLAKRSTKFLRFVPFKEPRSNNTEQLADDPEISGFDTSRMVFTDISFDASNQDRVVVVREPDGKLRTALPEEHDRMNRLYYVEKDRPVFEPPLFSIHGEWLQVGLTRLKNDALDRNEHEFVLDWACHFYEPDDPKYVELCKHIFDQAVKASKLDVLHSTRHFGTLCFYLLINGRIVPLLQFFTQQKSLNGAANTIRLWRLLFPSWETTVATDDSDHKVIEDFVHSIKAQQQHKQAVDERSKKMDEQTEVLVMLETLLSDTTNPSSTPISTPNS